MAAIQVSGEALSPDVDAPTITEWRALTSLFKGIGVHDSGRFEHAQVDGRTVGILTWRVSPGFLEVLGISSLSFNSLDPVLGTPAILTPIGRRLVSSGRIVLVDPLSGQPSGPLVIVGTLPDGFVFPDPGIARTAAVLIPYESDYVLGVDFNMKGQRRIGQRPGPQLIARLSPDVTPAIVAQALSHLPSGQRIKVSAEWLSDRMSRPVRPLLIGMLAAGVWVLLVCVGNVTTLFTIRTTARSREFATREALGAGHIQLVRLWTFDLAILAASSTFLGLGVAWATLALARGIVPDQMSVFGEPTVTLRVVACATAGAAIIGLASLLAAISATRRLSTGRERFTLRVGRTSRTRFAAATLQCTLATILAVGASLLVRSYLNLIEQEIGYDGSATTVGVRYASPSVQSRSTLVNDLYTTLGGLRNIPGVAAVAASPGPIVNALSAGRTIVVDGVRILVSATAVAGSFFEATGMTVLQGRGFTDEDQRTADAVVVNDLLAQQLWPNANPVERTISLAGRDLRVVGVVRRVFDRRLDMSPTPTLYFLIERDFPLSRVVYVFRMHRGESPALSTLWRTISGVRSDAVLERQDTIQSRLLGTIRDRTFAAFGLTTFGLVTLGVTVSGIVAIVAFVSQQRTREIAVRLALGAQRRDVLWLVGREAAAAAAMGAVSGVVAGGMLSRFLASLVYGIEAADWLTIATAGAFVAVTMIITATITGLKNVDVRSFADLRAE